LRLRRRINGGFAQRRLANTCLVNEFLCKGNYLPVQQIRIEPCSAALPGRKVCRPIVALRATIAGPPGSTPRIATPRSGFACVWCLPTVGYGADSNERETKLTTSRSAGVIAIAAVALGLGLAGCGSDAKSEPTTSEATATETTTTTSEAAPTTSAEASGPSYTIADYIRDNRIVESPVHRGDPGSPTIDLPFPPGWEDAGDKTPEWAYGAILSTDPAMAEDPPTIIALVSKLTGNVDPAKILEFAAGEIKNLPGYQGGESGSPSTLGGFDATQIGGTYVKDGVMRAIAQKTVVIPGQDGLYVLQLNADGREDQMTALMDATSAIDEQTTITP
jgi:hypothetical protein